MFTAAARDCSAPWSLPWFPACAPVPEGAHGPGVRRGGINHDFASREGEGEAANRGGALIPFLRSARWEKKKKKKISLCPGIAWPGGL